MKSNFRKVLFTFLLMGVLPAVAGSCDVLFYDAHAQTAGQTCVFENVLYPWTFAQLCYDKLAEQNKSTKEFIHPVSQSECDSKLLLALSVYREQCSGD